MPGGVAGERPSRASPMPIRAKPWSGPGRSPERRSRYAAHAPSASAAAAMASGRRLGPGERNRRSVGYQGVSVRSSSHRQSGAWGSITQAGRPMTPARCTTAVSTAQHEVEPVDDGGGVLEGLDLGVEVEERRAALPRPWPAPRRGPSAATPARCRQARRAGQRPSAAASGCGRCCGSAGRPRRCRSGAAPAGIARSSRSRQVAARAGVGAVIGHRPGWSPAWCRRAAAGRRAGRSRHRPGSCPTACRSAGPGTCAAPSAPARGCRPAPIGRQGARPGHVAGEHQHVAVALVADQQEVLAGQRRPSHCWRSVGGIRGAAPGIW